MRFVLLVLFLAACSAAPGRASHPIARQPDAMCVNDCLGAGGAREFCQSRCSD